MNRRYFRWAASALLLAASPAVAAVAQEPLEVPPEATTAVAPPPAAAPAALQQAHISASGELRGHLGRFGTTSQIRNIPNMDLTLISNGRVVTRARTDAAGEFVVPQVQPGVYTIVASNPKDLLLLPVTLTVAGGDQQPAPLQLVAASPLDPSQRQAMLASVFAGPPLPGQPLINDEAVAVAPPEVAPPPAAAVDAANAIQDYDVVLSPNGSLHGHVSVAGGSGATAELPEMMVRLLRGGKMIAEGPVAPTGEFTVSGLSPGPVSIVFFGPAGFAALGINLVPGNGASETISQNTASEGETLVSATTAVAQQDFDIEIAPVEDVIAAASIPGDFFTAPIAAPGFAMGPPPGLGGGFGGPGGGFGGGGGGLGGGGIGALAALGAIGAAAAILANEDDEDFIPVFASP